MSVSFSTIIQKARLNPVATTSNALREALSKMPVSQLSKLPNGLRVTSEENPHAKFATVGVWVEAGSRFDPRHLQGASKVLQQCGFHGTASQDRKQISRTVDELGGQLLVETGRELSFVGLKVPKEHVQRAVSLVSDVLRNARLSDADVEAARRDVELNRAQSEELVDDLVLDNLHVCAYDATETGGLGNPVNGTPSGIRSVTAEDLKKFRNTHITGPRTMLVGAGAVTQKDLEAFGQQFLGDLPSSDAVEVSETRYVGGDIRLKNHSTPLVHVMWAVEGPGAMSGDAIALQLATHIHGRWHRAENDLGNHPIHRIWKNLSSMDYGQCGGYNSFPEKGPEIVRPFWHQYSDTGLFGTYIVGRNATIGHHMPFNIAEQMDATIEDFGRMARRTIEDRELEQAKVNMKAQLLFNVDGSTNIARELARQTFLYGRRVPLEELYARIDDITAANMQEVLQHYFFRSPVFSFYGHMGDSFKAYPTLKFRFNKLL